MAVAIWKFYNNNSYITVAFRLSSLLSNIYKNKYFEKVASFTTVINYIGTIINNYFIQNK